MRLAREAHARKNNTIWKNIICKSYFEQQSWKSVIICKLQITFQIRNIICKLQIIFQIRNIICKLQIIFQIRNIICKLQIIFEFWNIICNLQIICQIRVIICNSILFVKFCKILRGVNNLISPVVSPKCPKFQPCRQFLCLFSGMYA